MNFKIFIFITLLILKISIANASVNCVDVNEIDDFNELEVVKNWERNRSALKGFYAAQTTESFYRAINEHVTNHNISPRVDNFDYETLLNILRERNELDEIPTLVEFASTWQLPVPLKAFLKSGVDLNSQVIVDCLTDQIKRAPVYRCIKTLRTLVEAGICVDEALKLEAQFNHGTDFLEVLLTGNATPKSLVSAYVNSSSGENKQLIFNKIVRSNPELISKVLWIAVQDNRLDLVKNILGNNIQPPVDSNNQNLLHLACIHPYNYEMIELLISMGLEVNARTNHLMTPLMIVAASRAYILNPGCTQKAAELLIRNGAKLETIGAGGLQAYEMAELNENYELFVYLKDQTPKLLYREIFFDKNNNEKKK